jgi:hypothetical protein
MCKLLVISICCVALETLAIGCELVCEQMDEVSAYQSTCVPPFDINCR